jgi:hypothetical protein
MSMARQQSIATATKSESRGGRSSEGMPKGLLEKDAEGCRSSPLDLPKLSVATAIRADRIGGRSNA